MAVPQGQDHRGGPDERPAGASERGQARHDEGPRRDEPHESYASDERGVMNRLDSTS